MYTQDASFRVPKVDQSVLNDLIRESGMETETIAFILDVESVEVYRWRYAGISVPYRQMKRLADAIGATIQQLLQLPVNTLIDLQALKEGHLINFDSGHPLSEAEESVDAMPIRMRDHTHTPFRRLKAQFGMDGMLMGPRTAPPTLCSCGRSLYGK